MLSTFISAFVFAGVLSAYIFLGRALLHEQNAQSLESRTRTTLYYFTQDVSAATGVSSTGMTTSTLILDGPGVTTTYTYNSTTGQLTRATLSPVTSIVLLTGIASFEFQYYDFTGIQATNPNAVKQIDMTYQTRAGYLANGSGNGAQSFFNVVSPRVLLKDKSFLQ
jgi:hypothetical protein